MVYDNIYEGIFVKRINRFILAERVARFPDALEKAFYNGIKVI